MKRNSIYVITALIFSLAAAALSSCVKEKAAGDMSDEYWNKMTTLSLDSDVSIAYPGDAAEEGTRYSVFPDGYLSGTHKFGFSLKKPDMSLYYIPSYSNLLGNYSRSQTYNPVVWTFNLNDGTSSSVIPLYANRGNVMLYSYLPYNEAVTDVAEVPFDLELMDTPNISRVTAHMYLEPLTINPQIASNLKPTLTYKHVMSAITFRMSANFVGSVRLHSIIFETNDGGNWIPIKGTFNAMDGSINSIAKYSNRLEVFIGSTITYSSNQSSFSNVYVVIPPIENTGTRKLNISFMMGTSDNASVNFGGGYTMDLSSTDGLKKGYRHTQRLYVDNFIKIIHFDPMETEPWGYDIVDIEI